MGAASEHYEVVVLGAGYAGLMAALRLQRGKRPLRVALINERDAFLERIRLQESIVADVPPRIASISAFVAGHKIEFICGRVMALDAGRRRVRIAAGDDEREVAFEQAIYALGSAIDLELVPGAHEHAYRLDAGDAPRSVAAFRKRLGENAGRRRRVVVIGGSETAIEVAGEIKTAWPETEVTMVSRTRCGDFRGAEVERVVRNELIKLGISLVDSETVREIRDNVIITATGRPIACEICVLCTGLRAPPIARTAGLATDSQGRVWVSPDLRSISHPHVFAVGDAAHPVAPTGAPYRLSAFAALVSGAYAADAIAQGPFKAPCPFSFSVFGQGVAIGRHGVGIFSYPDDKQYGAITTGPTARRLRNFFVWSILSLLKVERIFPGFFFWPGRRRVSWSQANNAMRQSDPATAAQRA